MAPVMTTRSKADSSSPWRYSPENLSDAYFGAGESQVAMIGQPNKLETDDAARLILTSSSSLPVHISFKRDNTNLGRLQMIGDNIVLGSGDLSSNSGTRLSSFGINSLESNTSGSDNTAIGAQTLTNNTTGECNTAIGQGSLMNNISGEGNNALGTSSLRNNTTGSNNTAVGQDTLYNSNGSYNTALGWYSMNSNTIGEYNTAVGANSLYSLTEGSHNVAVGYESLKYLGSSNSYNTAVGDYSQYNTTWGQYNTSIGYDSLRDNDGGSYNVAVGYRSNYDETSRHSSSGSVSIGGEALAFANNAISIGRYAKASGEQSVSLGSSADASGHDSISIGGSSVSSNEASIALGSSSNASGTSSIAIGNGAIVDNAGNVSLGGASKASGNSLATALGYNAYAEGFSSSALGAGSRANDSNSTALGAYSTATGNGSIAIGYDAKAQGKNNIAIGVNACSNVIGSNKVCIGAESGPKSGSGWASDDKERIFIGGRSKFDDGTAVLEVHNTSEKEGYLNYYDDINKTAVVVHGALVVSGPIYARTKRNSDRYGRLWKLLEVDGNDAKLESGNTAPYYRDYIDDGPNPSSDRRLKYVGKESQSGLDQIKQLKVFNYTFKKDETKTPHVGVIAQDLQKVFPDAVKKGTDGFLTIRFEDMFFAMINAIKELDLKYQAQEKRINELEARIERLEDKILY